MFVLNKQKFKIAHTSFKQKRYKRRNPFYLSMGGQNLPRQGKICIKISSSSEEVRYRVVNVLPLTISGFFAVILSPVLDGFDQLY